MMALKFIEHKGDNMLKIEIEMNEEKVLKEGKYDLNKMYEIIDGAFVRYGIVKLDKGIYRDNGSNKDWANMWVVIFTLTEIDWFINNVSKLMWYNSDYSTDENDFAVEDVLQKLRNNKLKETLNKLSIYYGKERERFLKENHTELYKEMLDNNTIFEHLINIDKQANEMEEKLVEQYCKAEGVTEELKKTNPMEWVGLRNNIIHRVRNIIQNELIHVV